MPTGDETEIMKFMLEEGGGELHEVKIANHMGWRVDYARSVLGSMGRRDFIDVLATGRIRLTERGLRTIHGKRPGEEQEERPRLSAEQKYQKFISSTGKQLEPAVDKLMSQLVRPKFAGPPSGKGGARKQEMRALIAKHKKETEKQRGAWRQESTERREYVKRFVGGLRGKSDEQEPEATAGPSPKEGNRWRDLLVEPEATAGPSPASPERSPSPEVSRWRDLLVEPEATAGPSPQQGASPGVNRWRHLLEELQKPVPRIGREGQT